MPGESGSDCRRRSKGEKVARLGKRIFLRGKFVHEITMEKAGRIIMSYIDIYADVEYKNLSHHGYRIVRLMIPHDMRPEDWTVGAIYSELPLMPNKKFRDLLATFLREILEKEKLLEVERMGIEKYLDGDDGNLARYSETEVMYEEAIQAMRKLRQNLDKPVYVAKLRQVLAILDVESAYENELVII